MNIQRKNSADHFREREQTLTLSIILYHETKGRFGWANEMFELAVHVFCITTRKNSKFDIHSNRHVDAAAFKSKWVWLHYIGPQDGCTDETLQLSWQLQDITMNKSSQFEICSAKRPVTTIGYPGGQRSVGQTLCNSRLLLKHICT